ncbi:SAV_2336 N-terminal domain-related protein [Streptomyces sp. E11-3]|uniref:SAV_2336 N-terminal domain-related protein n=1 Tax=Streptomyces sp. E11-3 TaxID=3110112 RepID=UPI00397FFBFD
MTSEARGAGSPAGASGGSPAGPPGGPPASRPTGPSGDPPADPSGDPSADPSGDPLTDQPADPSGEPSGDPPGGPPASRPAGPPALPLGLGRLADVLAETGGGVRPSSLELAELLWLARHMEPPERPAPTTTADASVPAWICPPQPEPAAPSGTVPPAPPQPVAAPRPRTADARVPLRLPGGTGGDGRRVPDGVGGGPGSTLLAPAPPMLARPLALQRALRPLRRAVPSPVGREFDEEATAHRIARLGAPPQWWLPVLRPASERWLRLHLVYDAGPTMPVWRPLIRELHTAIAQSGIFRTVELHRARPDGTTHGQGTDAYADGRTVTLLISDCMGPQWRVGPEGLRWYGTLRRWASRMPLAIVQPLPERLWRTTALPASPGLLTAPAPAVPNSAYTFAPYSPESPAPGLPLPVLEPSAAWLGNWATLVSSRGGAQLPGAAALLGPDPAPSPEEDGGDITRLSPEELVLRFRSLASPESFRLAGHLAVGRPELPVMRLMQAALERHPKPQHLAEVILSGMLVTTPGPPGSYTFRPGVREILLGTLPRSAQGRTAELLARVGAVIEARAGAAAGEFRAVAEAGRGDGEAAPGEEPFATVRRETVEQLAGARTSRSSGRVLGRRYRLVRQIGAAEDAEKQQPSGASGELWEAQDQASNDRTVILQLFPQVQGGSDHADFLTGADALSRFRHENVCSVIGFGFEEGTPYLVTEFESGSDLLPLLDEYPDGLPGNLLMTIAPQLASGLMALHEAHLVHGRVSAASVRVAPGGHPVLCRFSPQLSAQALGTPSRTGASKDLRDLGGLTQDMATGPWTRHLFRPEELGELPVTTARKLWEAVSSLRSESGNQQRQGARQLAGLALSSPPLPGRVHRLLGHVRTTQDGHPLPVGPPQQQAMLAMLLLARGRTVTADELVQGIWGDSSPWSAPRMIRTYAAHLRRDTLGDSLQGSTDSGYTLDPLVNRLDVTTFEDLHKAARTSTGDPERARQLMQDALDLWLGDPLAGVPGPAAEAARLLLHGLRLTLYTQRAQLDFDLGLFERAEADLAELLLEHPDNEDLLRLRMVALRRLNRADEALDAFESYANRILWPSQELLSLYSEIRGDAQHHATIVFEFPDPDPLPEAYAALGRAVQRLLGAGGLGPGQYEVLTRGRGHAVLAAPGVSMAEPLSAVVRDLPNVQADLAGRARLWVTFWHDEGLELDQSELRVALDTVDAPALVVVSPALYQELLTGRRVVDPQRFHGLSGGTEGAEPIAWYCPLGPPAEPAHVPESTQASPEAGKRELLSGPFSLADFLAQASEPPDPAGQRVALVRATLTGDWALLGPDLSDLPSSGTWPTLACYTVDLTTHRAEHATGLPTSEPDRQFAVSAVLSWQVQDPVAFVRGDVRDVSARLRKHLLTEAAEITRRYPLHKADEALRALHAGVRRWPVPGLAVSYMMRSRPGISAAPARYQAPLPAETRTDSRPSIDLSSAECVIVGFDGPLTRLYAGNSARTAAWDLAALIAERRDPAEALAGTPLAEGLPLPKAAEGAVHPLDVLRAFAGHPLADELRQRLDRIELRALTTATPTRHAHRLVRALNSSGRRVSIASNTSPDVIARYLESHTLVVAGGAHGRADDLRLLMPNPDCLHRALHNPGSPAPVGVMIGSSPAEFIAARAIGLRFIGYAYNGATRKRLREAGCKLTVDSLEPLLNAVRAS